MKKIASFILLTLFLASCSGAKQRVAQHSYYSGKSKTEKRTKDRKPALKGKGNTIQDYAAVINVPVSALKTAALYYYMEDWMGVPHKMGGTGKSGIDCSGFIGNLFREVYQINLPRTSRDMAKEIKTKRISKLTEGDLVFFSFGKKDIDHVGIYLHNNKFLHVSTSKGVMISDLTEEWFAKYFETGGSVR